MLDTALAEQLGMADIHKIRVLIRDHMDELEAFGEVSAHRAGTGPKGGRPSTAFYLNRQQALLVCILSKTEKAKAVRAEVIRRFDAYEELTRPAPVPALPTTYKEALVALLASVEENEALSAAHGEPRRSTMTKTPTTPPRSRSAAWSCAASPSRASRGSSPRTCSAASG